MRSIALTATHTHPHTGAARAIKVFGRRTRDGFYLCGYANEKAASFSAPPATVTFAGGDS